MRQCTEKSRQNIDLFMKGQVFVDDKALLLFHDTETGFGFANRFLQILFGYGNFEFVCQFNQLVVYLVWFHLSLINSNFHHRSIQVEINQCCVILLPITKHQTQNTKKENNMQPVALSKTQAQLQVNTFIRSVYNWMAMGLALTGFVAYYVANTPSIQQVIFGNRIIFYGLIIGELALVFFLSARVQKIQASTATALFVLYAALNGATLSVIFLIYTAASITSTFFICSATFVAFSVYGMTTKRDLTSVGGFMTMGLIGIIIASVVNMFIRSSAMSMVISYVGVLVFVGLTAYDTQKLKTMALTQPANIGAGVVRKGAIMGALTLYLDFINLFLMMLRILGDRR